MSVEQINAVRYKCTCEAVDTQGIICGHTWESDSIPDRCAKCKRPTWNRPALRHGRYGKQIVAFGKSQTLAEWSREFKIDSNTILARVKRGSSMEDAIQTPIRKKKC